MNARTAVYVLGMHWSGTSALTRMLNFLGVSLPRHLHPPGIGNETGHWEPEAAVRLHDRLLDAAGTSVNDHYGPSESWFQTGVAEAFAEEMKELISSEFRDESLFVFKDPRSALVFPLWRRTLAQMNIRCVAAVISRNPVEVALSLTDRQTKAMPGQSWPLNRGGLLWLRYTLAAERYTRDTARSFCLYSGLLEDWRTVARQLACDLDLSWPRPHVEAERDIDIFCPRNFVIIMSQTTLAPVRASGRHGPHRFLQHCVTLAPAMSPTGSSSTRSGDHLKLLVWAFDP